MISDDFVTRLKYEYHTLDKLTADDYYSRLSGLFVVLELDGERLNAEHELELNQLLERFNNINEEELHPSLAGSQLKTLVSKIRSGLAVMINAIEA